MSEHSFYCTYVIEDIKSIEKYGRDYIIIKGVNVKKGDKINFQCGLVFYNNYTIVDITKNGKIVLFNNKGIILINSNFISVNIKDIKFIVKLNK